MHVSRIDSRDLTSLISGLNLPLLVGDLRMIIGNLRKLQKRKILSYYTLPIFRPTEPALRQAQVPIVDIPTCDENYDQVNNIGIDNSQVCAGLGDRDSCSGDSGGPMLSSELNNGRWSVIGITSFGVKCGDPRFPGVYTRVDQYLDWISRNTQ